MTYQMKILVESLEIAENMTDDTWFSKNHAMSRKEYMAFIMDQIIEQVRYELQREMKQAA